MVTRENYEKALNILTELKDMCHPAYCTDCPFYFWARDICVLCNKIPITIKIDDLNKPEMPKDVPLLSKTDVMLIKGFRQSGHRVDRVRISKSTDYNGKIGCEWEENGTLTICTRCSLPSDRCDIVLTGTGLQEEIAKVKREMKNND